MLPLVAPMSPRDFGCSRRPSTSRNCECGHAAADDRAESRLLTRWTRFRSSMGLGGLLHPVQH